MSDAGDRGPTGPTDRSWLLGCEGMRVVGPAGEIGTVVVPLYSPSARWDRPWALSVRGPGGDVTVPITSVESVDVHARRIDLSAPRYTPRSSARRYLARPIAARSPARPGSPPC